MQGSLRILSRKSKSSLAKNDADTEEHSIQSSAVTESQELEQDEVEDALEKPAPVLIPGPKSNTAAGKVIPSPKPMPSKPTAAKADAQTKAHSNASPAVIESQDLEQAAISDTQEMPVSALNLAATADTDPGKIIPAPKAPTSSPARKPKQKVESDIDHDAVERALRHADPDDDLISDDDSASHEARRLTADKPKRSAAQSATTQPTGSHGSVAIRQK